MNNKTKLEEVNSKLLDRLLDLEPGTEDYDYVFADAMKGINAEIEITKLENSHKEAEKKISVEHQKISVDKAKLKIEERKNVQEKETKQEEAKAKEKEFNKELYVKIGTCVIGVVLAPVIDLVVKRSLAGYIGRIEQMETFTSTPGRSMSGWFRFK